jgi:transcriptional regulator with XRE-family HTH domain
MTDLSAFSLERAASDVPQERSRWLQARLLQAFRKLQLDQSSVADEISIDESALSRFLSGKGGLRVAAMERLLEVLEMGLNDRDADIVMVPKAEWEATRLFARKALEG